MLVGWPGLRRVLHQKNKNGVKNMGEMLADRCSKARTVNVLNTGWLTRPTLLFLISYHRTQRQPRSSMSDKFDTFEVAPNGTSKIIVFDNTEYVTRDPSEPKLGAKLGLVCGQTCDSTGIAATRGILFMTDASRQNQ